MSPLKKYFIFASYQPLFITAAYRNFAFTELVTLILVASIQSWLWSLIKLPCILASDYSYTCSFPNHLFFLSRTQHWSPFSLKQVLSLLFKCGSRTGSCNGWRRWGHRRAADTGGGGNTFFSTFIQPTDTYHIKYNVL